MLAFFLVRLRLAALVLFVVSLFAFGLLKLSGGDLATTLAGENATAEYVQFLRTQYGWDRPILEQYFVWLGHVLSGDLGKSFYFGGSVTTIILDRLPVTVTLGTMAVLLALSVSVPLGVVAAVRPGSWIDRLVQAFALGGQAMPTFGLSFLLILFLGINLQLFPISGAGSLSHYVMPAMALGYAASPAFVRIVRGGMIDALAADYVRTARAKGLGMGKILFKHALKNALVPLVSVAAVQFGFMLGGSVVIETVFAMNGLGYLAWESITQSDYPVVQAIVLTVSVFYVLLTLASDLLNAYIDPRIRLR
jgi:peptide/nickel transport system permease protein